MTKTLSRRIPSYGGPTKPRSMPESDAVKLGHSRVRIYTREECAALQRELEALGQLPWDGAEDAGWDYDTSMRASDHG